jgi:hypothetical protein
MHGFNPPTAKNLAEFNNWKISILLGMLIFAYDHLGG